MKKWLAFLLAPLLLFSSACALEITDEDFDYWYETMTYLVDNIGTRECGTPGEKVALEYMRQCFEELGYSAGDGTLLESSCQSPWSQDESISLIAVKPALNPGANIITVCAHYDSAAPEDIPAPGARDNASGAAAMMLMCRLMSQYDAFENTELRFIAFSAEESGHQGSIAYCESLTEDERQRSLATFNIDILVADVWEDDRAFSLDTMGLRTPDGYVTGSLDAPAFNRAALAMLAGMDETGMYPADEEEVTWCGPRHKGQSDHESYHLVGIDSVNVCFRGTTESGGRWPEFMHTPSDTMGDFDLDRSRWALDALYTALDGLASDCAYGDDFIP